MSVNDSNHHNECDHCHLPLPPGEDITSEVLDMETAAASASDATPEETLKILKQNPMAYFQKEDFNMQTSDNDTFLSLKRELDAFFKQNGPLIHYLRSNTESAPEDLESMYKPPPGHV